MKLRYKYKPSEAEIRKIVYSEKFEELTNEARAMYPSEAEVSIVRWAFILYMGWDRNFFKPDIEYKDRFTLPGRSTAEKNAVSYAASLIVDTADHHAINEEDLSLAQVAEIAQEQTQETLGQVVQIGKWAVPLALIGLGLVALIIYQPEIRKAQAA